MCQVQHTLEKGTGFTIIIIIITAGQTCPFAGRSEDNFQNLVLYHVGPGDRIESVLCFISFCNRVSL